MVAIQRGASPGAVPLEQRMAQILVHWGIMSGPRTTSCTSTMLYLAIAGTTSAEMWRLGANLPPSLWWLQVSVCACWLLVVEFKCIHPCQRHAEQQTQPHSQVMQGMRLVSAPWASGSMTLQVQWYQSAVARNLWSDIGRCLVVLIWCGQVVALCGNGLPPTLE